MIVSSYALRTLFPSASCLSCHCITLLESAGVEWVGCLTSARRRVVTGRSQRQLVNPIIGSWRNYGRKHAGTEADDDDWITDYRSGPQQLAEFALTAKGHFHSARPRPTSLHVVMLHLIAFVRGERVERKRDLSSSGLERWTDPKLSRRTCTCEYVLQSCRGKSAGVARRRRERSPTRNPYRHDSQLLHRCNTVDFLGRCLLSSPTLRSYIRPPGVRGTAGRDALARRARHVRGGVRRLPPSLL